jgi:kynurenine 3-monooxygenase
MTVGRAQDKAILSLLAHQKIDPKDSLTDQLKKVQEETNSILSEDTIEKTLKH